IDANHIACSPTRGELCVTAFAAAAFQHDLVAKKFGCNGRDPTEKLFGVAFVFLCEVLPLPAESRGRGALIAFDVIEICETRNAGGDEERIRAGRAAQLALDDLAVFGFSDGKIERRFTRWA